MTELCFCNGVNKRQVMCKQIFFQGHQVRLKAHTSPSTKCLRLEMYWRSRPDLPTSSWSQPALDMQNSPSRMVRFHWSDPSDVAQHRRVRLTHISSDVRPVSQRASNWSESAPVLLESGAPVKAQASATAESATSIFISAWLIFH